MCVWKRKNYEINKCLSLVHLTAEFLSRENVVPGLLLGCGNNLE